MAGLSWQPEALWRALMENPDIAVAVIEVGEGVPRVMQANPACGQFTIIPWDEINGHTLEECTIPEVAVYLGRMLPLCVQADRPSSYERAVDLAQGRKAWATNLIPVAGEGGRITHVIAMGRPIPFEMHGVGNAERNAALIESLQLAAPGLVYLFNVKTRRNRFIGGQLRMPLGYKPYEIEEMDDPIGTLFHPEDRPRLLAHFAEAAAMPDGEIATIGYRLRHREGHYRSFSSRHMVFSRDTDGSALFIFGIASDVTDEHRMQAQIQDLIEKQVTLRTDERRQIARALHDSTGQHIVAAELALARIQVNYAEAAVGLDAQMSRTLSEVRASLQEAEREIRVLTYLLHPPTKLDRGLAATMRSFLSGFSRRAGIAVDARIDGDVDTVPERFAAQMLRVCQEALTNVHRHAQASEVAVTLERAEGTLRLTVADNGVGLGTSGEAPPEVLGLGLSGMRERMERLGGSLALHGGKGTTVVAVVPLGKEEAAG